MASVGPLGILRTVTDYACTRFRPGGRLAALSSVALVVASMVTASCSPGERLTLTAFTGSGAGEVVLEWTGGPRSARGWQYQYRPGTEDALWADEWHDVPGSGRVRTLRVGGLEQTRRYQFRVRPQLRSGTGEPSEASASETALIGYDGVAVAFRRFPHERGGAFRLPGSSWTFRVPTERTFGVGFSDRHSAVTHLEDLESGARIVLDLLTGGEVNRFFSELSAVLTEDDRREVDSLFDEIAASMRYSPLDPDGPLVALLGGGAGEALLEWKHVGPDPTRWQYRFRAAPWGDEWGEWSSWDDIGGSDTHTRALRVIGLPGDARYGFEVRPWLSAPGPSLREATVCLPHTDPGDVVQACWSSRLESGQTFRFPGDGEFVFDVPSGISLKVVRDSRPGTELDSLVDGDAYSDYVDLHGRYTATALVDVDSGSSLVFFAPGGHHIGGRITPEARRRGVDALFDQIVASTRRAPPPSGWRWD